MKRLVIYFVISLICNTAILVFLFLPHNNTGAKIANGGKPEKRVTLIPARLLPDINENKIGESLNNQKYRPVNTTKETSNKVKNKQEDKAVKNEYAKTKEIIKIPDHNKKKKKFMTPDEYRSYKKSQPLQGTIVTEMRVGFPKDITERIMRDIISFFGFKVVAYHPHNPNYLMVCNAPDFKFKKLDTSEKLKRFYSNNSNRTIESENDLLYWTRSELGRQGKDTDSLKLSIVLGNAAGYFHWKEMLAVRNVSRSINEVSHTEASIARTPQGYWILLVEGIYLKNGQYLKVEDQELKEIFL
jgi:hypothetical protein